MIVEFDGQKHEFPDDAKPDEIRAALDGFGGQKPRAAPGFVDQAKALFRGVKSGMTAGLSGEMEGLAAASGIPKLTGPMESAVRTNPLTAGAELGVGALRLGVDTLTGRSDVSGDYEAARDAERAQQKQSETDFPKTHIAGEVAGALALPGGTTLRAATLPARMGRGAMVGAAYGGASGFGEGEGLQDKVEHAASGAAAGSVIGAAGVPAVEGLVRGGARLAAPIVNAVRGAMKPEDEAARRVVTAIGRDIDIDPNAEARLTPGEFAASRSQPGGGPAVLADLGGETTRALARSAANTSPEGRRALNAVIDPRFEGQTGRVVAWLRDAFNHPSAQALQETLDRVSGQVNKGAYTKAYRDGDKGLWSPELKRLTSSPDVVAAMREASTKGKSRAVTEGGGFNPGVTVDQSGNVTFARGQNGVPTYPNLQFWDYAKRALDDAANSAKRGGRNEEASTLGALARQLRGELDRMVPSYSSARAGAAAFFGAENALEAGQKFVTAKMSNGQAMTAIGKMTAPEKKLFQDGFVSRFIDYIQEIGDRRTVLNSIAASPAARERLMMVLGPARANQLEAGLRVEGIMDLARGAVQGNSTTARQLAELGFAGGAGMFGIDAAYHLDPSQMAIAALSGALLAGRRYVGQRVGGKGGGIDRKR